MTEIRVFLINALRFEWYGHIYIFFEREGYTYLKGELNLLYQLVSKLDDYLLDQHQVVKTTQKGLELANGAVVTGEVLKEEIRKAFFNNWDHHFEIFTKAKRIYEEITEGKFMMMTSLKLSKSKGKN
jgi:hypothetical protein